MTRFRVNIKQLSDSCSDFNSDYDNYNTAINNYYNNLSSIGSAWSDDNTEYYVNKNNYESRDVSNFNRNACDFIRAISDFSGRLTNIASRCGIVNPNILSYNGDDALNAANNCGAAVGSFGWAKYTLSHYWAPDSYRYKWQYDNLRYQIQDLANWASNLESDIRSIFDDVESSVNNLKDISSRTNIDEIQFDDLDYKGYVEGVGSFYMPDESDANVVKYGASKTSVEAENEVSSSAEVETIVGSVGHPVKNTDADIHSDYKGKVINTDSKDFVSTRDIEDIHSDYKGKVINTDSKDFVSTRDIEDIHSDKKVGVESGHAEIVNKRESKKTDDKALLDAKKSEAKMNKSDSKNVDVIDAGGASETKIDNSDIEILSSEVSEMKSSDNVIGSTNTEIASSDISQIRASESVVGSSVSEKSATHISEGGTSDASITVDKTEPTSSTKISSMDAISGNMEVSGTNVSTNKVTKLDSSEILNS